jgi:hypothetical protein
MLKLGELLHVTVAAAVNEKYHPAGVSVSGRRAALKITGSPVGNVFCDAMVSAAPPPVVAAGAVMLPLNPPEAASTSVPPLAGIATAQGLVEHATGVAVAAGVGLELLEQPATAIENAVSTEKGSQISRRRVGDIFGHLKVARRQK